MTANGEAVSQMLYATQSVGPAGRRRSGGDFGERNRDWCVAELDSQRGLDDSVQLMEQLTLGCVISWSMARVNVSRDRPVTGNEGVEVC